MESVGRFECLKSIVSGEEMRVLKELHIIRMPGALLRPKLEIILHLTAQILASKNDTCKNNYCFRFEGTM